MQFSWTKSGIMAVTMAIMAFQGAFPVVAQYVPNGNGQQGYSQYQPQPYPQYSASQYSPPQNNPTQHNPPQNNPTQYNPPQNNPPQYNPPQNNPPQYTTPQYTAPQYTAMAYQANGNQLATPTLNQPIEAIGDAQQPAASQDYSANADGQACQPTPTAGYAQPGSAYPSNGCANSYNTFSGGGGFPSAGCCGENCAGGGRCCGRQWFGGIYGLYMERDGNPWKALSFSTLDANGPGYYPADTEYVLNLNDIDNDTFSGAEVRLGATIGGCRQSCCGNDCGCGPRHAWEVAYWGLIEDDVSVAVTDLNGDGNRLYGMIDYRGLEYDSGAGYRSVNDYYDYGPPTQPVPAGDTIRVRSITARNSFTAQNFEMNLLHLPVICGGCCGANPGCCGGGRGGCAGGSCGLGGGCCQGGYGGPRYSLTTLVGARYMRFDEDFMFRSDFENETATTFGFLSHNVDVENHLVGAQLGCNGIYHLGCQGRWALHCNSNVGIYGNHMEVWNRMDSPTNSVRYANGTNAAFNQRYEDDNVAVIGELRVGGSYQYSCNWRVFGGYRLLGISGVALAFDQISDANITPAQVSYVDSDGSIFLHGVQAGVECTY